MRTAFIVGVLLGLAGVLAAAKYVPWVNPPRLPSHTSVVANGGRAEAFVIRLPADRISAHGGEAVGVRGGAFPAGATLPDALGDAPLLVEQFKVRDRDGNVIGVAARHWSQPGGQSSSAWLLVIPSRGALLLEADGEPAGAIDAALAAAGRRPGGTWSGSATVDVVEDGGGRVVGGSGEFDGLEGRYGETWTVTGVGDSGELKGTIELNTVTFVAG
ncbi:MAG TPA: hypothetical protein VF339_11805 [Gammaproteobacteria bacterium]